MFKIFFKDFVSPFFPLFIGLLVHIHIQLKAALIFKLMLAYAHFSVVEKLSNARSPINYNKLAF